MYTRLQFIMENEGKYPHKIVFAIMPETDVHLLLQRNIHEFCPPSLSLSRLLLRFLSELRHMYRVPVYTIKKMIKNIRRIFSKGPPSISRVLATRGERPSKPKNKPRQPRNRRNGHPFNQFFPPSINMNSSFTSRRERYPRVDHRMGMGRLPFYRPYRPLLEIEDLPPPTKMAMGEVLAKKE